MTTALESLKKCSVIVADSGDLDAIAKWRPQDTTTNPSLLLSAAQDPRYRALVDASLEADVESSLDRLFVAFGCEILKHILDASPRRSTRACRSTRKARFARRGSSSPSTK